MVPYLPYLLAGLVIWGVVALVRHSRRLMAEQKQMLLELGFQEVATVESELLAKVNRLRNVGRGNVRITRAYLRQQGYYKLYLLHIWTGSRSEDTSRWCTAIFSRELAMPLFTIVPALPLKGRLGNWLSGLLEWAAKRRGMSRLDIPRETGCAESHYFFAEQPTVAVTFFPPTFWERLKRNSTHLILEGCDDLLLFRSMPGIDGKSQKMNWVADREAVRQQMETAERIFGWLRECGTQAKKTHASNLSGILSAISEMQVK